MSRLKQKAYLISFYLDGTPLFVRLFGEYGDMDFSRRLIVVYPTIGELFCLQHEKLSLIPHYAYEQSTQ